MRLWYMRVDVLVVIVLVACVLVGVAWFWQASQTTPPDDMEQHCHQHQEKEG